MHISSFFILTHSAFGNLCVCTSVTKFGGVECMISRWAQRCLKVNKVGGTFFALLMNASTVLSPEVIETDRVTQIITPDGDLNMEASSHSYNNITDNDIL